MSHDKYSSSHQILVGVDPDLIAGSNKDLRIAAAGDISIECDNLNVNASEDIILASDNITLTSDGDLTVPGTITAASISGDIQQEALVLSDPVNQIARISGSMFLPLDNDGIADFERTSAGRLNFLGIGQEFVFSPSFLPNGATINAIKVTGYSSSAANTLQLKFLITQLGVTILTLVDENLSDDGSFSITINLSTPYTVDYFIDEYIMLHIISGILPATTTAYIDGIDILYSIESFPVSTDSLI